MGGKGGDSGGSQQQMEQPSVTMGAETARLQALQKQKGQTAAEEQTKKPAEAPVTEDPLKQKPADQQPAATTQNLTGLGDALVGGLSQGRSQTTADPTKYDPMTGIYAPQNPLGGVGNNSGQL